MIQPQQNLNSSAFSNAQGTTLSSLTAIYGNHESLTIKHSQGQMQEDTISFATYNKVVCHHFNLSNARIHLNYLNICPHLCNLFLNTDIACIFLFKVTTSSSYIINQLKNNTVLQEQYFEYCCIIFCSLYKATTLTNTDVYGK